MSSIAQPLVVDNGMQVRGGTLELPMGDTASRPNPSSGDHLRSNTDTNNLEIFNGGAWKIIEYGVSWFSQSTNYTIPDGLTDVGYWCDTTGGTLTNINLPAFPIAGHTRVFIGDYKGQFATHNLTVGRNNRLINGGTNDFLLAIANEIVEFFYVDSTVGWKIVSSSIGIAASVTLGNTAGSDLGTSSAGTAMTAARSDHVHNLPTLATLGGAPTASPTFTGTSSFANEIVSGTATFNGAASFTSTVTVTTPSVGDNSTEAVNTAAMTLAVNGATNINVSGNSNVTLTQAQWGLRILTLTGVLTGNINLVFPTSSGKWAVINNTTGSYSITATTGSGHTQVISAGTSELVSDGTNIYAVSGSGSGGMDGATALYVTGFFSL